MRCLETSRRLSQFVGEEIYNVCSFSVYKLSYQYMALDETMKTIVIYVWRSKYRNSLRSGLPKKMGKSKDRPWSQVNEEKLDIERDSLPAQDIIQHKQWHHAKIYLKRKKRDDLLRHNGINFTSQKKWLELIAEKS